MHPLKIAILGCGSRGRTYASITASLSGRYQITSAVDPVEVRTAAVAGFGPAGSIRTFRNVEDFLAAGKLADVIVIATQDALHFDHATAALHAGYLADKRRWLRMVMDHAETADDPHILEFRVHWLPSPRVDIRRVRSHRHAHGHDETSPWRHRGFASGRACGVLARHEHRGEKHLAG